MKSLIIKTKKRTTCVCKTCNKEFEITNYKFKEGKGKYCSLACRKENSNNVGVTQKLRDLGIEPTKAVFEIFYQKKRRYNLNPEEYIKLLKVEECEICGMIMTGKYRISDHSSKRLATEKCIDHCHKTGKVRGVLCHDCNKAIGMLKDNIGILKSAINYLRKHEENNIISDFADASIL